jgi:hypothetical protein
MKVKVISLVCLLAVAVAAGSCRSRTDRSSGTVLLTFGTITGIPTIVSVGSTLHGSGAVSIGNFILQSINKDPTGTTSALQDIEVNQYQVVYKRRDTGTRVPPTLLASLAISVPINGQGTILNLPIFRLDQLENVPLSDLATFGADQETGTAVIVIDAQITFFGATLSGDKVASAPADFTIEFTP